MFTDYTSLRDVFVRQGRNIFKGGGSLPHASAPSGVFRYPLCVAPPRNAPKGIAQNYPAHSIILIIPDRENNFIFRRKITV
jgi:hypothetical protein